MAGPAAATTAKAASSSSAPRAPSPFIPTGRRPTLKQMALMAWEVVKVFSAPINNPVLRLCSLWAMIIYVIFTFAVSLVAAAVGQLLPSLKPPLIDILLAVLVWRRDPFSAPYLKIIRDS